MFTSWQLFLQVFFSKVLLGTVVKRRAGSKMTYVVSLWWLLHAVA
jgi:hypothetical protein